LSWWFLPLVSGLFKCPGRQIIVISWLTLVFSSIFGGFSTKTCNFVVEWFLIVRLLLAVGIVQLFIDQKEQRTTCPKQNRNWTGGAFEFCQGQCFLNSLPSPVLCLFILTLTMNFTHQ